MFSRTTPYSHFLIGGLALLLSLASLETLAAQENDEQAPGPDGQFISLESPLDDDDFGLVSRWALKLQAQADREKRPMFLVLEIPDGATPFHQVYGMAELLASNRLPDVRVIAWLPETVTGHNAILPLVANEIVMAEDAEIGDIGRGNALDIEKQDLVLKLIERGRNPFVNRAIAKSLMDPASDLRQATLLRKEGDKDVEEIRFLTSNEITLLQDQGVVTPKVDEINPGGTVGKFTGQRLKQLGMLVSQVAESRIEVARLYQLPRETLDEPDREEGKTIARLVKLEGPIDFDTELTVGRQIDRAVDAGANVLIVEITSPGGMLGPSNNLSDKLTALSDRNIRTIAYVPKEAISGGALIAFGCDEIYLHPDAHIGDIGPIEMREGGQFHHADSKVVSFLRDRMRTLAEKKGRPPALLMSMIDRQLPVYRVTNRETGRVWFLSETEIQKAGGQWEKGELIDGTQAELFLTVDGKRAAELLIAEAPVESLDDLQMRIGIPEAQLRAMQANWVDQVLIKLNTQAAMFLLFFGMIGFFYLELHLPGGLFGMLSALCLVVFFWAKFLGGTAGWLEVLLLVLGVVCILIEVFLIPGLGVVGLGGGVMVLAALVMAAQTFNGLDGGSATGAAKTLATLFGAGFTVIVFAVGMSYVLPRIPFFNRMALSPPGQEEANDDPDAPRLKTQLVQESPFQDLIGTQGKAVSLLKPFGKAKLNGQYVEVVSEGEMIDSGTPIEVIEVEGRKVIVREVV